MTDTSRTYTTTQAAAALGVTTRHAWWVAGQMGLGVMRHEARGAVLELSEGDIEQMRARDTKKGPKFRKGRGAPP